MGFSTIATVATTAAAVLPKVYEARAASAQAKALNQAAGVQQALADKQADAITGIATANQIRGSRNAIANLGTIRADAAASNTMQEGSTYVRGIDMATRLQDEINAAANEQLERANSIRSQGAYDAWDLRNQARRSRMVGRGAAASGLGSLIGGMASGLG